MGGLRSFAARVARAESQLSRRVGPRLAGFVLAVLIAGSCALAVTWAFVVPIYQGPDEIVTDDYSFSILRAGHLVTARDLPPGVSHPYTTYLANRTGGERMPFHSLVKAPPDYGTPAYFKGLDSGAPSLAVPTANSPYLVTRYPFGYFAIAALWLAAISAFAGSGPVTLFFAARLLSVVMLAFSLALTYAVARELAVTRLRALALTGAIGFFPMTTFVASYAQADNLSWLLVSATWLAALRSRWRPGRAQVATGLLLGLLLVTKYQFFLCTAVPVLFSIGVRLHRRPAAERRLPLTAAVLAVPSLVLGAVQYWVGYGSPFPLIGSSRENTAFWTDEDLLAAAHAGPMGLGTYVARTLSGAVVDYFGGGPTFRGFWGEFGWSDTILLIRTRQVSAGIRTILLALTVALLILVLVRLWKVARRSLALRRAGRRRPALAVLTGQPVTATYLLFVLFMLGFYVLTDDSFYAQGRNWLPVILGAFVLAVFVAPRALGPKLAPALTSLLLAGLVLYSAVASHYALTSVNERYYGNGRGLVAAALPSREEGGGGLSHGIDYLLPDRVRPGEPLALGGWVGSTTRPDGVLTVYVEVDGGRDVEAVYGDSRDDVVAATGAPSLARSGFDLIVPTDGLAPGVHVLSLKVVLAGGATYYRPPETRSFTVSAG